MSEAGIRCPEDVAVIGIDYIEENRGQPLSRPTMSIALEKAKKIATTPWSC